jgi:3D-(3,5/4)-trihydroxycyclohexane-1,2-dione acylhydrolase (decyclizing)
VPWNAGTRNRYATKPPFNLRLRFIRRRFLWERDMDEKPAHENPNHQREKHAAAIAKSDGNPGDILRDLPRRLDLSLSEALLLGLLRQGVRTFFSVLGHGSTEVGEVLRIYQEAGLVKVYGLRSEIEASHAATALRWVTGEKAAVVTSIGPGALQALAASIVPASDGIGVWYLFGDETTEDEGFNMQQVPRHEQGAFHRLASVMGNVYTLHTPMALPSALRRGAAVVDHPTRPGPFFLLMPMNTQAARQADFNLDELPQVPQISMGPAEGDYALASRWIHESERILIKAGGGGRRAGPELAQLMEFSGGVLVHTPIATGCIPYGHRQNMTIGGSKGSICGNYAMEHADLLIAVGTRAVCQSDCSRTGYPNVKRVININADLEDAIHYNHTLPFVGDVRRTLARLLEELGSKPAKKEAWLDECAIQKKTWQSFKQERFDHPVLWDEYWQAEVLTQPATIKMAVDWAKARKATCFFDAGDVQANGFQVIEDDQPNQTFTEAGASYMGFAVSALLATAAAAEPFHALALTGDGSFTMNPQVLIDGAEHGAHGCILLLDNGRMGAITGLQNDQYGKSFATWNTLQVNYRNWAEAVPEVLALDGGRTPESLKAALEEAGMHSGLSFIHVPVYFGPDPLGGMGVYGRWNVGNWSENVQKMRHEIGL